MQLEDYFAFLDPEDIRIKGTRMGIETILHDYIHRSRTPEEIAVSYVGITLEQVYATILYYLHNKEAVSAYLADWIEYGERARAEQAKDPVFLAQVERLRQRRAARERAAKAGIDGG